MNLRSIVIVSLFAVSFEGFGAVVESNLFSLTPWNSTFVPSSTSKDDSFGFEFSITSPIKITQLGAFARQNSFGEGVLVTLWDTTTELALGSGAIASGSLVSETVSPFGGFTFIDIDDITLQAGSYRLVGAAQDGQWNNLDIISDSTAVGAAGITLSSSVRAFSGAGSIYPDEIGHPTFSPASQYMSVNAKFVPVPEPAEYACVMAIGLLMLGGIKRLKKRGKSPCKGKGYVIY